MRRLFASLLLGLAACGEGAPAPAGPWPKGPPSPAAEAPLPAVPTAAPPVSAPAAVASAEPTGSGIPLDAPASPPPPQSPPPSVARGTGTPADRILTDGDIAFAKGDFAAAEKAYKAAGALDWKDPAPIVGAVRARIAKAGVPTDYNAAPRNATLTAAVKELGRAIKLSDAYAPAHI
jgi:hypothetical protein